MSVYRRGRVYWSDFAINGIRVRRPLGTARRSEAVLRERELFDKLAADASSLPAPPLRDIADEYLKWARVQHPNWARMESTIFDRALAFFAAQGVVRMDQLNAHHVDLFKVELRGRKPPLSPATVNRYVQTIRALFYRAADWKRYDGPNPAAKIKMFRESRDLRPLSDEDFAKVLKTARTISDKPTSAFQRIFFDLVVLCANTGLRRSEALNLKWQNVDTDALMIRGKGNKTRLVPLNIAARDVLARQPRTSAYVFDIPTRDQTHTISRTYTTVGKSIGRPFRLHDVRHKFATDLLGRGADIKTVSEILGHQAGMTTLLYLHSTPDKARRAVSLLDSTSQSTTQAC
jgi:integrase